MITKRFASGTGYRPKAHPEADEKFIQDLLQIEAGLETNAKQTIHKPRKKSDAPISLPFSDTWIHFLAQREIQSWFFNR
jgi:hypothetical protein